MSVYVDDMEAPFGRLIMCHMIADTRRELLKMADHMGVDRRWLQSVNNYGEHFDIAKSKRALAVSAGAIEIGMRELAEKCLARRTPAGEAAYIGDCVISPAVSVQRCRTPARSTNTGRGRRRPAARS